MTKTDPYNMVWVFLILAILAIFLFFNPMKEIFIKIVIISFLFILFSLTESYIFSTVKDSVKTFLSNLFVERWKAFPFFLLEIYIFYILADMLEKFLTGLIDKNALNPLHVIVWIIIMYIFYWFKGSRE